ncbi:MAG TPA: sialidase family protein [Pyrinomonadaceae bacterium]|jgi:hypothetical protein
MNNGNETNSGLWSRRDVLKMAAGMPAILAAENAVSAFTHSAETAFRREMREIPDTQKFLISDKKDGSPDPRGWYHHSLGVVDTPDGLICTYRQTDSHTAVISNIMTCRSTDRGRTWRDHKMISKSDVWSEGGCWVAPQLSRLRDGRLVLIADFGNRTTGQNWPMLSDWQKPPRGMSNHLFWSSDNGRTWTGPQRIDELGGEPGYIIELADGTLVYTRTESSASETVWNPPMPWGKNYYQNVAVFSDDRGKTWVRTAMISDEPLQGDCEVGLVELRPNDLMAMTRIGLGAGAFGQPSRFIFSRDNGKTWGDAALTPIYGQRTIVRKLQSGKLFATYRNSWGTPGSYCVVWDADEKLPYQPSSYIWDESRCTLADGAMKIESFEGREKGVVFALYPAQAPDTRVEIEAELRVERAEKNGCSISAGCFVRFMPDRVDLADRPADGFAVDATKFRKYRLLRENGEILIFVDGELKLRKPTGDLETRLVHFGNRFSSGWTGSLEAPKGLSNAPAKPPVKLQNAALTEWKSLRVKVENKKDHSIDWKWTAGEGFPDQFRRSRIVRLDRNASFSAGNSGYSGWTEMKDGTIIIADYTCGSTPAKVPFARAYVTSEKELLG